MEPHDVGQERGQWNDIRCCRATIQHAYDGGKAGRRRHGDARAQERDLVGGAQELATYCEVEQRQW